MILLLIIIVIISRLKRDEKVDLLLMYKKHALRLYFSVIQIVINVTEIFLTTGNPDSKINILAALEADTLTSLLQIENDTGENRDTVRRIWKYTNIEHIKTRSINIYTMLISIKGASTSEFQRRK